MSKSSIKLRPAASTITTGVILATMFVAAGSQPVFAESAEAKKILRKMSDTLVSQTSIAFAYDTALDVVTDEGQVVSIASSGGVAFDRDGRLHATRTGGFSDVEMMFDGTDVTVAGRNADAYATAEYSGSVEQLLDVLHDQYGFPVPGADILVADPYAVLMDGVTDVKDLGAGVIGGVMCDHIALRTETVDWQIFVAQGDRPLPCRYVITSEDIEGAPRYQIDFDDWATGGKVAEAAFTFDAMDDATLVSFEELRALANEIPSHFKLGDQ
ncbi:DUF2092 domain-containing protein [Acuticoccus sp. MNP-M23]|uniref:DUF2092 domain-containing protein n=1 Tax=Acuticoccus sp. MNP-M23 TaxID=3072793 RepID=UPI0028153AA3|nr:DUF2092 domain-containing protein [Acuticoccus sp. MNP-M23]WMS45004.1 DUF2092 domain-containing protein [Acuticoccus sp. MNP-M23]